MDNSLYMKFDAKSQNEAFARSAVASFVIPLNPSLEEINDIKTAVSEAATNAVVHAYKDELGTIEIFETITGNTVEIIIQDQGVGIEDIKTAIKPFYTTKPDEERAGMGFAVMQALMDEVEVKNREGGGLIVKLIKHIN
ncbi:MAG: anti-sigma F factor [Clostridia bacterium]|nr:anti-sigma F factor [Clostridia bacterium]